MRINIKMILLLPGFAFTLLSSAQVLHNEFALDIAPLVKRNTTLGILYRHHGEKSSFRLSAAYVYDTQNEDNNELNVAAYTSSKTTKSDQTTNNLDLRLGWQRNYGPDKWKFYMGLDGVFKLDYTSSNKTINAPGAFGSTKEVGEAEKQRVSGGVAPVFGFAYPVTDRFMLSFETGFSILAYSETTQTKTRYYFYDNNGNETLNNTVTNDINGSGFRMNLSPVDYFRFYLGYRF